MSEGANPLSKPRVVQVTIGHPPDDGRVRAKIGRSLARGGYESHILCPGGHAGRATDGVVLHPHSISESRFERVRRHRELAQAAAALQPDVIHVHEPIMLGAILRARGSAKVVWDVHEDYELELSTREWIPKPLRRLVWRLWDYRERRLLSQVDLVLVATPPLADRYRLLHSNVAVVPNLTEVEVYHGDHEWTKPHAVFTGSVFESRGLMQVIEALGKLHDEGFDVPMTIAGPMESQDLEKRIHQAIDKRGLANSVKYVGVLPREEVIELCRSATIGVVAHLPESQGDVAWPVKMFEYMACGLPLIYTTLGAMVRLADDHEIGIAVEPFDIEALANAFTTLATDHKLSAYLSSVGRNLILRRYHWSSIEPILLQHYEELLRTPRVVEIS
jgi:glycosyltransferase involved in cell wall biosynthesis